MSVHIQKAGILTTIQDLGRNGFRSFGINPNGAMDKRAARLINILLANDETEAVLEMHFPAPVLEFADDAIFALGGADFGARLNDRKIENWRLYFAEKESVLEFAEKKLGNRAYFAVKGGFAVEKWLGSAATNLRAGIGKTLQNGDKLAFNEKRKTENGKLSLPHSRFSYKISPALIPFYSSLPTVRVAAGAEFERLTALSERDFLTENFTVSNNSDRMGFRLTAKPLYLLESIELVSSAVDFGTIQLLPDGQIIVLMADHQTSGGYPRLAHVAAVDLPTLSQLGAGDKVNFQLISGAAAEELLLGVEKQLNLLKIPCSFKNIRHS